MFGVGFDTSLPVSGAAGTNVTVAVVGSRPSALNDVLVDGSDMQAVLQDPAGQGDGTVPLASSRALDDARRPPPGDQELKLEHQPAYENRAAQQYTVAAIIALAKMHYEDRRAGKE